MATSTQGGAERPGWAQRVIDALDEATAAGYGEGRLTEAESDLLWGIRWRLLDRLGEPGDAGYDRTHLGSRLIGKSARAMASEIAASGEYFEQLAADERDGTQRQLAEAAGS